MSVLDKDFITSHKINSFVNSLGRENIGNQVSIIHNKKENVLSRLVEEQKNQNKISYLINEIGINVYQSYLKFLTKHDEAGMGLYTPVADIYDKFKADNRIRFYKITKWVNDKEEKNIEKLANVYQTLNGETANVCLLFHRTAEKTETYIAVVNNEATDALGVTKKYAKLVNNAFSGNFPGIEFFHEEGKGTPDFLNFEKIKNSNVASVSCIPSEKSEDFISQSMEKLLDGVIPAEGKEYTVMLLAEPEKNLAEVKSDLSSNYTNLSKYESWQQSFSLSDSKNKNTTTSYSSNVSAILISKNDSESIAESQTLGASESMVQNNTNYAVKHTLELMDKQMERLEKCSACGMWNFAAYFISDDIVTTNNLAHIYMSLIEGEDSYLSESAINVWKNQSDDEEETQRVLKSLSILQHPVFTLNYESITDDELSILPACVNASVRMSGTELAHALNFPRKSISGLPVLESVSFGREVSTYENNENALINVGKVYHMRNVTNTNIQIDVNSLSSHVFVTGSTGTGKSKSIYGLLDNLFNYDKGIHFLVIEPVKGEYKYTFGKQHNVKVFGSNPNYTDLFRINPFSFPQEIHILEHIDRLVEIMNVCWPMYAAMPAILKDAVEESYKLYGWNLKSSTCINQPARFPTFYDVLESLQFVMDKSLFSGDTKSDYAGALITRVKSLTNGINGLMFCAGRDEITNFDLFEQNVIVDLSRIGSMETKSLAMGILLMKLQEYKLSVATKNQIANKQFMDLPLQHITVIEEAHNLLKKTSTSQSQESSNVQGKSVEMITNSIAEMRTYGEGFIIVDQSPALLDESVIRNTNTKIVLRLPDEADRKLVGSAMALNENQIQELAKLPTGVAAIYQNNWVESVLCKFPYDPSKKNDDISFEPADIKDWSGDVLSSVYLENSTRKIRKEDVDSALAWIEKINCPSETKRFISNTILGDTLTEKQKMIISYNILEGKKLALEMQNVTTRDEGINIAKKFIKNRFGIEDDNVVNNMILLYVKSILSVIKEGEFVNKYGDLQSHKIL
ncbi:DUF87 domain-containing protein [Butyrivibrio fibrisolvens]|uniref:ATP-binding protein n=1 Tax=Pseudobutyrivibrio ruminis TaxID=46206 RepID=UPI000418C23D|nr:DUF87 domain-containing protein [Pseudobutyrivibrio ruminis]MDC7278050.1 DUF87 domain-containing protein [Butyrivibrio fibrisolvens]